MYRNFLIVFLTVGIVNGLKNVRLITCGLKCDQPQPRAVRVAELINTTNEILPYMAVVHRCDEASGCCNKKGFMCKVAKYEQVKVSVLELIKKNYQWSSYVITNHTLCSCQTIDDTIK